MHRMHHKMYAVAYQRRPTARYNHNSKQVAADPNSINVMPYGIHGPSAISKSNF